VPCGSQLLDWSGVSTLKRRGHARGSDVCGSCSCFWLLADSGRWRSDRCKRVRLRLNACARSSPRPSRCCRVTGRQDRYLDRKVRCIDRGLVRARLPVEGASGRPSRRPSRDDGENDLDARCAPKLLGAHRVVTKRQRRAARSDIEDQNPSRPFRAANRSVSQRREPRGAPGLVGLTLFGTR
jgi:hypothetical protein